MLSSFLPDLLKHWFVGNWRSKIQSLLFSHLLCSFMRSRMGIKEVLQKDSVDTSKGDSNRKQRNKSYFGISCYSEQFQYSTLATDFLLEKALFWGAASSTRLRLR